MYAVKFELRFDQQSLFRLADLCLTCQVAERFSEQDIRAISQVLVKMADSFPKMARSPFFQSINSKSTPKKSNGAASGVSASGSKKRKRSKSVALETTPKTTAKVVKAAKVAKAQEGPTENLVGLDYTRRLHAKSGSDSFMLRARVTNDFAYVENFSGPYGGFRPSVRFATNYCELFRSHN
jgi:hypothetical protein